MTSHALHEWMLCWWISHWSGSSSMEDSAVANNSSHWYTAMPALVTLFLTIKKKQRRKNDTFHLLELASNNKYKAQGIYFIGTLWRSICSALIFQFLSSTVPCINNHPLTLELVRTLLNDLIWNLQYKKGAKSIKSAKLLHRYSPPLI